MHVAIVGKKMLVAEAGKTSLVSVVDAVAPPAGESVARALILLDLLQRCIL